MNLTISMTMRRALDLIGVHDPAQLSVEAAGLAETHPLRRVNELLTRCLYDIDNAERVMRIQLEAVRQSADREIGHLDQGYATGDWPMHYAGKAETGRRKLERAFEQVNILADLRRLLHTHTPDRPASRPAAAGRGRDLTSPAHPRAHHQPDPDRPAARHARRP